MFWVRDYFKVEKMAEGGDESSSTWWGGWVQTAKDKSVSAYEFVKQDITEFASTMSKDVSETAEAVKGKINVNCSEYMPNIQMPAMPDKLWTLSASQQETANAATSKVKAGLSSLIGGITKALIIPPDEEEDTAVPVTVYDMAKARLTAIQLDLDTYVKEPDAPEQYEEWLMTFVLDEKKGDISELLVSNAEVRSLYTQLVPNSVSHADFWNRYFFKVYQLEQDEARKEALKKRAEVAQKDLTWEEEEDEWGDIDGPSSPPNSSAHAAEVMAAGIKAEKEAVERLTAPSSEDSQTTQEESTTDTTNKTTQESTDVTSVAKSDIKPDEKQTIDSDQSNSSPSDTEAKQEKKEESDSQDTIDSSNNTTGTTQEVTSPEVSEQTDEPKVKEKGDLVVVSSERATSPASDVSSQNTTNGNGKESSSLDDDWEKDFDIEVTEEDLKMAQEAAKKVAAGEADDDDDDWENWE